MRTNYNRPSVITIGAIIAIGIMVPVLVASVLVFSMQAPLVTMAAGPAPTPSTSSTSGSPGPCAGGSPYTGPDSPAPTNAYNTSLAFPIFAMPANGVVEVCVVYVDTDPATNVTLDLASGAIVGTFGTQVYPNGTVGYPFMGAPNITVTANQTEIALGGTEPATVDVAYTISANGGSRGFYFLNIGGLAPESCTDEFRLAVGYNFTQSNETGPYFPIPSGFGSCNPAGADVVNVQYYSVVYAVKGVVVVPLACGTLTCDLDET
jgi:hypothetical protein